MTKRPVISPTEARLRELAALSPTDALLAMGSHEHGLDAGEVARSREEHGPNETVPTAHDSLARRLWHAFADPFTAILVVLAAISLVTDVLLAAPGEQDPWTATIIGVMVAVSGGIRFVQETRSGNAMAALASMVRTTCSVERAGEGRREVALAEVVPGDVVWLSAGDMVPADLRILSARDLYVSQSTLTGESVPVEKVADAATEQGASASLPDLACIALMGTSVISGSGSGVVVATGGATTLGGMASTLSDSRGHTAFDEGVGSTSRLLVRIMAVCAPIVFLANGIAKGSWLDAALFAVSVAVGLTPEMLPMIVTTCLAKGATDLGRRKVVVRRLDAIQDLGSLDVLCCDKTGTLTEDSVILERHLDVAGQPDNRVLAYAFLNSRFETGMRNLMDKAILSRAERVCGSGDDLAPDGTPNPTADELAARYHAIDELPFDFERRRVSVLLAEREPRSDGRTRTKLVTKGALEEVLAACSLMEYAGEVVPLTPEAAAVVRRNAEWLADKGMRVLAVAYRDDPRLEGPLAATDERDMVLMGYLAFLDPPKASASEAVRALSAQGVATKVLTGDSSLVARRVCETIGIPADRVLEGRDLDAMDDGELRRQAEQVSIFAKLSPTQKARVVQALRANGHVVGHMGDGMNDAAAMRASDCGISVDTAADVAREAADIILLEKDLMVLEHGIEQGRRTIANTSKYLRMTASSNLGNVVSVLVASVALPFLPMTAVQLLLLNLMNDLCSIAMPWDNVDEDAVRRPLRWDADGLARFMWWFGPASSAIDMVTFALLFWVVCPAVAGGAWGSLGNAGQVVFAATFQAGWFVESMWTQVAVQQLLRTERMPVVESRASWQVTSAGLAAGLAATLLPLSPAAEALGFAPYPLWYLGVLALVLAGFCALVLVVRRAYLRTSARAAHRQAPSSGLG